ncbi:hypothetical protein QBL07_000150 (plasmid) [Gordonia rubripertincta]|uniref:Uncharacterized protein n=1 Tax=Gordonia rubripertincta TaxID=36822 RepID=A0AAW6RAN3_GORRU|nr:hypothetical protein [Gordonia rubripertincta]MCZ4537943.1 hypothetical protein [Gordonia terrae]MDG6782978.1 hypothetical protein [Gordonia rubripertincta]
MTTPGASIWKSRPVVAGTIIGALLGALWPLINTVSSIATDGMHGYGGVGAVSYLLGGAFAVLVGAVAGAVLGALIGLGVTALTRAFRS